MKQGRATLKGPYDRKVEPNSREVNPGGVDREGQSFGAHTMMGDITGKVNLTPMYGDRGYMAPSIGTKFKPRGSQGRY